MLSMKVKLTYTYSQEKGDLVVVLNLLFTEGEFPGWL